MNKTIKQIDTAVGFPDSYTSDHGEMHYCNIENGKIVTSNGDIVGEAVQGVVVEITKSISCYGKLLTSGYTRGDDVVRNFIGEKESDTAENLKNKYSDSDNDIKTIINVSLMSSNGTIYVVKAKGYSINPKNQGNFYKFANMMKSKNGSLSAKTVIVSAAEKNGKKYLEFQEGAEYSEEVSDLAVKTAESLKNRRESFRGQKEVIEEDISTSEATEKITKNEQGYIYEL